MVFIRQNVSKMNSVIEFPKQNNFSLERPKIKNRDQNQLKLRQLKRNLTFLKDLKIEIKVFGNVFHEFNSVIRIIRFHDPPKTLIQLVILRSSLSRWSTSIKASNLDFMVILLETNFFEELVDAGMVREMTEHSSKEERCNTWNTWRSKAGQADRKARKQCTAGQRPSGSGYGRHVDQTRGSSGNHPLACCTTTFTGR